MRTMKRREGHWKSGEGEGLDLGVSKPGDIGQAADPEDELLQASLREARGEDDPAALAWLEERREAWWGKKLAWLPDRVVDALLRARRALLRAAARLASARRRMASKG